MKNRLALNVTFNFSSSVSIKHWKCIVITTNIFFNSLLWNKLPMCVFNTLCFALVKPKVLPHWNISHCKLLLLAMYSNGLVLVMDLNSNWNTFVWKYLHVKGPLKIKATGNWSRWQRQPCQVFEFVLFRLRWPLGRGVIAEYILYATGRSWFSEKYRRRLSSLDRQTYALLQTVVWGLAGVPSVIIIMLCSRPPM